MSHLHHKVSALIDGELQGHARRRALAHVGSCPACRNELEATYALKQRLLGLAPAEPSADLFAALGTVTPAAGQGRTGPPRATALTRRVLYGAGSVSVAVLALAYVVGGPEESTSPTVAPPVNQLAAEFAGITESTPLSDPPVQALAPPMSPVGLSTSGTQDVSVDGSTSLSAPVADLAATDSPRAVAALNRAMTAPNQVTFRAVERVWPMASGRAGSLTIRVEHVPGQGTSFGVPSASGQQAVFVADAPASTSLERTVLNRLVASSDISVLGNGVVAGRAATVIGVGRGGVLAARFWVDDATGLLLRRDTYTHGMLARTTGYLRLVTNHRGFRGHLPPVLQAPPATTLPTRTAYLLNDEGWTCPGRLPGGYRLTLLHRLELPHNVMHAAYSNGLSTVSVFEERGTLDSAKLHGFSSTSIPVGSPVLVRYGLPTVAVWESSGTIYTVVTDAPRSSAAQLIRALPHHIRTPPGASQRVRTGLARIAAWLNPGS